MKCKQVQKLLPAYLEEALIEQESALLLEHLQDCDACRRELRALEKTIQLAGNIQIEYPPPELWDHFVPILHARLAQSESEKRKISAGWLSPLRLASYGVATLIFIGFLALGISIMISNNRSEASPLNIKAIIAIELMDDTLAKQAEMAHISVVTEDRIDYEMSDSDIVEEDDIPVAESEKQIIKQVVNAFAPETVYTNGFVNDDLQEAVEYFEFSN